MSKLSTLIDEARIGLSIQQTIPAVQWDAIAKRCGAKEVEEIKERIDALRAELANVEEWDGDTQDDINIAISKFSRLLALIGLPPKGGAEVMNRRLCSTGKETAARSRHRKRAKLASSHSSNFEATQQHANYA